MDRIESRVPGSALAPHLSRSAEASSLRESGRRRGATSRKTLWTLTAAAVLAAAGLGSAGCSALLYPSDRQMHLEPATLGAKAEEVYFRNETGKRLHGWYFVAHGDKPPKGQLVFFHGNGQNLSSHFPVLLWLLDEGYSFFIFDYQGYGLSSGHATPEGTVLDGVAALRWAHQRHPHLPLGVFGQSLGGAVALRSVVSIGKKLPIRLVAVDSTFLEYRAAAQSILRNHWMTWPLQPLPWVLLSDEWAPGDRVREISPIPLLVIHGTHDPIIDLSLGQEVFRRAAHPKELWIVDGGGHIDAFSRRHGDKWRRRFVAVLDGCLAEGATPLGESMSSCPIGRDAPEPTGPGDAARRAAARARAQ